MKVIVMYYKYENRRNLNVAKTFFKHGKLTEYKNIHNTKSKACGDLSIC